MDEEESLHDKIWQKLIDPDLKVRYILLTTPFSSVIIEVPKKEAT